jgi:hypothetical protein
MKNTGLREALLTFGLILLFPIRYSLATERPGASSVTRAARPPSPPRGREAGPRSVGIHLAPHLGQPIHPINNPAHQVVIHNARTGRDEHHPVILDGRPGQVIDLDPHIRIGGRGYHPKHNWDHFHPGNGGWWFAWSIGSWDAVGTVTCEAANEATGELYPVSQDRDANGWDDPTVNLILDQALDDCVAEAGDAQCDGATPACTFFFRE